MQNSSFLCKILKINYEKKIIIGFLFCLFLWCLYNIYFTYILPILVNDYKHIKLKQNFKTTTKVQNNLQQIKNHYFSVLDHCGEICETEQNGIKSKFFSFIAKNVNCKHLWYNYKVDESHNKSVIPFSEIPYEFKFNLTYGNKFSFNDAGLYTEGYLGKSAQTPVWTYSTIHDWTRECGKGILNGNYGSGETSWLFHGLRKIPSIVGANILVIGSENPWVEACCLAAGANKVITLEYGKIMSEHPQIQIINVNEIRSNFEKYTSYFDVVVSFSSIEHVGLGRYGEVMNPWGDRQTIARAWCITKPGGYLLLGVPVGDDSIQYNAHRVYGSIQYPHLVANWHQQWRAEGGEQRIHLFRKSIDGQNDPGLEQVLWVKVNLQGRLGNQLFQVASAYGISKQRNARYCVGDLNVNSNTMLEASVNFLHYYPSCPNDVTFEVSWETVDKGGNQKFVKSVAENFPGKSIQVGAYLQSFKYFKFSGHPFVLKFSNWADEWTSSRGFNTAIHVRENEEGQNTPISFYKKALQILKSRTSEDLKILVCSNNFAWVKQQNFFDDMFLVDAFSPGEDMAILSSVSNLIIGWGTFGWWSAYLKRQPGPIVYYNAPWNFQSENSFVLEDHYLPEWIKVDPDLVDMKLYGKHF